IALICLVVDGFFQRNHLENEIKASHLQRERHNEAVDRILGYLAFMKQKGHYRPPKTKFPPEQIRSLLTDAQWDKVQQTALLDVARFYDPGANLKDLINNPNSIYSALNISGVTRKNGSSSGSSSIKTQTRTGTIKNIVWLVVDQ
uniref:Uncharacterized protein n=1 Tax=Romanomermis culicivorax TaxID=13658 RepID=A0A915L164_ROMCU